MAGENMFRGILTWRGVLYTGLIALALLEFATDVWLYITLRPLSATRISDYDDLNFMGTPITVGTLNIIIIIGAVAHLLWQLEAAAINFGYWQSGDPEEEEGGPSIRLKVHMVKHKADDSPYRLSMPFTGYQSEEQSTFDMFLNQFILNATVGVVLDSLWSSLLIWQVPSIKELSQDSGSYNLLVLKSLMLALRYGAFTIPVLFVAFVGCQIASLLAGAGSEEDPNDETSSNPCACVGCGLMLLALGFLTMPSILAYITWVEFGYIIGTEESPPGDFFEAGSIWYIIINIGSGVFLLIYGLMAAYCFLSSPGTIVSTVALFIRYVMVLVWGPCGTWSKERADWELSEEAPRAPSEAMV